MVFYRDMRNQNWLFPPSVLELISEPHLLVDEVIESMDFSEIEEKYQVTSCIPSQNDAKAAHHGGYRRNKIFEKDSKDG